MIKKNQNTFEKAKKINKHGTEYWTARDLAIILKYSEYRHFLPVIKKAKTACKNSGQSVSDHFEDILDMIKIAKGTVKEAERGIKNIKLSRYACYLIVQNADPSKKIVALGQTYFAVQTRRQEEQDKMIEDRKRVELREEMKTHNKKLAKAADNAGVSNYGVFQDYGYMGLYGGLRNKDIHKRKKLTKSQKILDHMESEELAANLFRATQTEAKLKRENIQGQTKANDVHHKVGGKVRETIKELGGTMPEELPPADGIGRAKTRLKKVKNETKNLNSS
jgi:DNA-damage-inducible protein D